MSAPVADRICAEARKHRGFRPTFRPKTARTQQRLRGETLTRHHFAASRNRRSPLQPFQRLAETARKTWWTKQNSPTFQRTEAYRGIVADELDINELSNP